MKLLEEKRGIQRKFEYIGGGRVMLLYEMPLNEILLDFYAARNRRRAAMLRLFINCLATAFADSGEGER